MPLNLTMQSSSGKALSADPLGNVKNQRGEVTVALHPTIQATTSLDIIQIPLPFWKNECLDESNIRVFEEDGITEFPCSSTVLVYHQNWDNNATKFAASVNISIQITLADLTTVRNVIVRWGHGKPTVQLPKQPEELNYVNYRGSGITQANYVNFPAGKTPDYDYDGTKHSMPLEVIMEPKVWANIAKEHLQKCNFVGFNVEEDIDSNDLQLCYNMLIDQGDTAMNNTHNQMLPQFMIPFFGKSTEIGTDGAYGSDYSVWLYDRALGFQHLHQLTGDLKFLIAFHRAAYYFSTRLSGGVFTNRLSYNPIPDTKYSSSQSMYNAILVTGATSLKPSINDVTAIQANENYTYNFASSALWTEREILNIMNGALVAWELTGDSIHKQRVTDVFSHIFALQQTPVNGGVYDGSFRHTTTSHGGSTSDVLIASPWMSSLLAGIIERYWHYSKDSRAIDCIIGLADFVLNHGTYVYQNPAIENSPSFTYARYIAGAEYSLTAVNDPVSDIEHNFDVAGLLLRGALAKYIKDEDATAYITRAEELIEGAAYKFEDYRRPQGNSLGYAENRLKTPRKLTWHLVCASLLFGRLKRFK